MTIETKHSSTYIDIKMHTIFERGQEIPLLLTSGDIRNF